MKYKFNTKFSLQQQQIPNFGLVKFALNKNTNDIVMLDDTTMTLLSRVHHTVDEESNSEILNRLISEEVLLPVKSVDNWDPPKYTEKLSFWLQVTDRCNLACSYCYIPSLNSKRIIRPDLFSLIKNKLLTVNGLKFVYIKIAGGEPLMAFKHWREGIITLRYELKIAGIELNLRLISNLTILTEEMISFIKDNHLGISISLDGTEAANDKNRIYSSGKKGTYAVIQTNLKRLKAVGIKPSVMITVTSDNQYGIPDLISFLVKEDMTFRIADAKGGHIKPDEFELVVKYSTNIIRSGVTQGFPVSDRIVISDLNTLSATPNPCSMGTNGAAIYLDGSIYFCHTEFESGNPLGNLDENTNLMDIILRGKSKQFGLSNDCLKCEFRLICAGGCPLYRVNGKSPMCHSYKKIIRMVLNLYEQEKNRI